MSTVQKKLETKDEEIKDLKESLARLESQVGLVTSALNLVRRTPPPKKVRGPNGKAVRQLKEEGYVTEK